MASAPPDVEPADAPRTPLRRLGSTRKLAAFASVRAALSEQTRALEQRAEAAATAAHELADYCRRRSELEHEYSKALDKLSHRGSGGGGGGGGGDNVHDARGPCVVSTGAHCRALGRAHSALGTLYGGALASRAARAAEHAQRMARRARALLIERQEEVAGALLAAAAHGKAHATAVTAWKLAAAKLKDVHDRKAALLANEPTKHKKLRALDKELDKRRTRHSEARARALRARHEHALTLEEANAALQRYYLDDIADMMLCTEVGYEAAVSRVAHTAAAAESCAASAAEHAARALRRAADAVDAPTARRRLLATHPAFVPPTPHPPLDTKQEDDELSEVLGEANDHEDEGTRAVSADLAAMCDTYTTAATRARLHCQEAAKTLDAAEAELIKQMEGASIDVSKLFAPGVGGGGSGVGAAGGSGTIAEASAEDTPRRDQEDYYLAKVRAYVWSAGRVSRLEARAAAARVALGVPSGAGQGGVPRRAGRGLFAAPLPNDRLPNVLVGCVNVISQYGLSNQGIFRVSGAHADVSALRAALDRGEEALAECGGCDVNAVCTLLKLWLRSLRPPLLPRPVQQRLLHAREAPSAVVRSLLSSLPVSHMIALRYLCAFLAHAATRSARTRMDAWNLAICLGPTLLAAQGAPTAQVAAQNALNHLLKRLILQHEQLFPQDLLPHTLYVPPPLDADDGDVCDTPCTPCTPAALHDELQLYVDDDEEEEEPLSLEPLSLDEDGCGGDGGVGGLLHVDEACDDVTTTAHAWTCVSPSPPPPAAATPPPTPVSPSPQRAPKPKPPKRCESSLSCGATAASDATTAHQEQEVEVSPPAAPAPPPPPPAVTSLPSSDSTGCRRSAPDLVLGLPASPALPPPAPIASPDPSPEAGDPADAFVHNRGTLKKRPPTHRHVECSPEPMPPSPPAPPPPPPPPPVEDDSEQPALKPPPPPPARPALLRRPTPHPQHTHTHTHTTAHTALHTRTHDDTSNQ